MKVTYRATDKLVFELEGSGQKEIFKELALIQEIFSEEKCGLCGSTNLKFIVRNVDNNDYFELRCNDCGAILAFGQHKREAHCFQKEKMIMQTISLTRDGINGLKTKNLHQNNKL